MRVNSNSGFKADSRMTSRPSMTERMPKFVVHYKLDWYKANPDGTKGELVSTEEFGNLVTNEGLNDILNKYFKGSSYTAAWYVGLKGAGSPAAGDTLASHAGWSEVTNYSGNRKALTLGTVSAQSVDNSASKASFTFTGTATVAGAFIATVDTGTSGILYSVGNFSSSKAPDSGDILEVTATLTQADDGV